MKSNPTKIAIIVIAVLAVAFGGTLTVFLIKNKDNRETYEEHNIIIYTGNTLIGEFSFDDLLEYSPAVEFKATYKTSGKPPVEKNYSGIYMKDLLEALNINLSLYTSVKMKASDGMEKVYSVNDVLEEGNVYIANLVEGKPFNEGIDPLAYLKPEEDGGPYVVIKAHDIYSQNRVKMLTEIILL